MARVALPTAADVNRAVDRDAVPGQRTGRAYKSQRLPHGTGGDGAAGGGGALVGMSAAVAAPNGAAMSNAEMPIITSEVRFMVFPHLKAVHFTVPVRNLRSIRDWTAGKN